MTRLFFALDINNSQKSVIAKLSAELTSTDLSTKFKPVVSNNYHITLCFLGEVSDKQQSILSTKADELSRQLSAIKPQQLLFNHLGLFKKPKTLYLGTNQNPDWLFHLATELSTCAKLLGLHQENRPYLPHLSLFRKASFLPELPNKPDINITIHSFSLYQSTSSNDGVNYCAIKTWKLA